MGGRPTNVPTFTVGSFVVDAPPGLELNRCAPGMVRSFACRIKTTTRARPGRKKIELIWEGRFAYMIEQILDASERRGRVDILVGVGRRRRWPAEAEGRIVAESYGPGAIVSEVARRHDMAPQHLFAWRKAARAGRLTLAAEEVPMFVPVAPALREGGGSDASAKGSSSIVIEIVGAVVRAERGVDLGWLRDVLRAVRAAT